MRPERAHYFTMYMLRVFRVLGLGKLFFKTHKQVGVDFLGLHFPNKIGLAAGFDKDARWLPELQMLGFGHIEVGTVTPLAQPGNPKPRLFRLLKDEALINRMGFNNLGVDSMVEYLKNRPKGLIVGGNIGKNKTTPNDLAFLDYQICFKKLYNFVDYFTVNVSSPNTPGLRELQDKEPLMHLLSSLVSTRQLYINEGRSHKPILLKIAPDLTNEQLDEIITIYFHTGIEGIVATNTTIERNNLESSNANEAGGLSGKPVTKRSTEVIHYIHKKSLGKIPLIGVGGIHSVEDAQEKLDAGASLVQLYTGFIYGGPGLLSELGEI